MIIIPHDFYLIWAFSCESYQTGPNNNMIMYLGFSEKNELGLSDDLVIASNEMVGFLEVTSVS